MAPRTQNASNDPIPRTGPEDHLKSDEKEEQEDIYRGEPPSSSQSSLHAKSTSSLSSSSGSSGLGLRRGTLGAILDRAINRWARATSGSSSSSVSSAASSQRSRHPRRSQRRSSNATSYDAHSEHMIRARRKAQDESRILQREFALLLPAPLMHPPHHVPRQRPPPPGGPHLDQKRVLRTTSLPLVLAQLDSAIKKTRKLYRPSHAQNASNGGVVQNEINDYMQPNSFFVFSQLERSRDKGKTRESPRTLGSPRQVKPPQQHQSWWLDISSPTWSDMREIGKLLHLHPLTLEDILHQDPREKFEPFPRLGYYFIVTRALGSEHTRRRGLNEVERNTINYKEDTMFVTNVYIVVFRDGICSFHFEDISGHTERVRNKIDLLEQTIHMSSEWIAHGLLDSIVDDFFPMLHSIEQEVKELDDFVFTNDQSITNPLSKYPLLVASPVISTKQTAHQHTTKDEEKMQVEPSGSKPATKFSPLFVRRRFFSLFRSYVRPTNAITRVLKAGRQKLFLRHRSRAPQSPSTLIRMASARKLLTSLSRLIWTKSEVVSHFQKHLMNAANTGLISGTPGNAFTTDMSTHVGDIHDHILGLQSSITHYERILNYSHPAYSSHVRTSRIQAKAVGDKNLLKLSIISIAFLAMNVLTGVFTLNLGHVPHNLLPNKHGPRHPPGHFYLFGIVTVGCALIGIGVALLSRYWWLQARKKFSRRG